MRLRVQYQQPVLPICINPNLLVGLAYKESSLDPTADNDGARRLFQIRRPRQKDLGLSDADVTSVDAVVDPVAKYLSHSSSVTNRGKGSCAHGRKAITERLCANRLQINFL